MDKLNPPACGEQGLHHKQLLKDSSYSNYGFQGTLVWKRKYLRIFEYLRETRNLLAVKTRCEREIKSSIVSFSPFHPFKTR